MPDKQEFIVERTNHSLYRDILTLTKPMVTLGVTLTSVTGYVINSAKFAIADIVFLSFGIILLSGGASAFNHVIERKTDALMERTKSRPIASGRVSSNNGLLIGFVMVVFGFAVLSSHFALICALLGLANVLWYNLIYTPLKRVTVWAVFVGSITGVIPFFIGVFAASNYYDLPINIFVAVYLLMWQIPHFFILAVQYGDEYANAGLASILNVVSGKVIRRITLIWIIACCMISLLIPLFGLVRHNFSEWIVISINILVFILIVKEITKYNIVYSFRIPFLITNLMQVLLMVILVVDRLV